MRKEPTALAAIYFMQYLLTQEELDALKGAAEVERQVRERLGRIAVAVETVVTNYGKAGVFNPYQNEMLRELQKALRTP